MKLKKLVYFIIFFLFVGALLWGWLWMQGEAEGTVGVGKVTEDREDFKEINPKKFQGEYFTLEFPGNYEERSHDVPKNMPVIETLFLVKRGDTSSEKIAITLENRTEKTYEASPGFQLRANDSGYQKRTFTLEDREFLFLTKASDPFEKTLYFFEEGILVSISYTSIGSKNDIETEILAIQKSFTLLTEEERQKQSEKAKEGLQ